MICPYCHQENRDDAKFCRYCGQQIGLYEDVSFDDSEKPEKHQVQSSVPSAASPQQPDNSKWIVIIVAIIAAAAVAIVACYFLFNAGKRSGKNVTKNTTHIIERQKDADDNNDKNDVEDVDDDDDDDTYHGSDEFNAAALSNSTGYLMPDSSSEYLTRSEVSGLTSRELSLARNEIFARHHRLFSSPTLQNYFNGKSWYDGYISPDDFDDSTLNSYERANVDLLKDVESSKGWYIAP